MPCLISSNGQLLDFRSFPARFGTSPTNEILVPAGLGVAGHHFTIRKEGSRLLLESSGQGPVVVNGNEVRRTIITDGDKIEVGQLKLVYSHPGAPKSPYESHSATQQRWTDMLHPRPKPDFEAPFDLPPIPGMEAQSAQEEAPPRESSGPQALPAAASTPTPQTEPQTLPNAAHPQPAGPSPVAALPRPATSPVQQAPAATAQAPTPAPVQQANPVPVQPAPQASPPPQHPAPTPSPTPQPVPMAPNQTTPKASNAPAGWAPQVIAGPDDETSAIPEETPMSQPEPSAASTPQPEKPAAVDPEEEAELLSVFFDEGSSDDAKSTEPPSQPTVDVSDVDIPALPEFEEDEEEEEVADPTTSLPSADRPGQQILPTASKTMRRPPAPRGSPIITSKVETVENSAGDQSTVHRASAGQKRGRFLRRRPKTMVERMQARRRGPRYRGVIPWHKVAIGFIALFAIAGAYMATEGQPMMNAFLEKMGWSTETGHQQFLDRFLTKDPVMLLSMDTDACVEFYRESTNGLDVMRVGQVDEALNKYVRGISLSLIDHLTFIVDRRGQFLALASSKEEFNRRLLVHDLSRGLSIPKKVGAVTVHSGVLGLRQIQFALLDRHTIVLGEPGAVEEFLSKETQDEPGNPNPLPIALARNSSNYFGLYVKPAALEALRSKAPLLLGTWLDQIDPLLGAKAKDYEMMIQIGAQVSVSGNAQFDENSDPKAFLRDWKKGLANHFEGITSMLGPNGKPVQALEEEMQSMKFVDGENGLRYEFSIPNRWVTQERELFKSTIKHYVTALRSKNRDNGDFRPAATLLSRHEIDVQQAARSVEGTYAAAMDRGAAALQGVTDINEIIGILAKGTKGAGKYRNVEFEINLRKGIEIEDVARRLHWKDGDLIFSPFNIAKHSSEDDDA